MNMSYRLAFCKTIAQSVSHNNRRQPRDGSNVNDNRFQYMQERHLTLHVACNALHVISRFFLTGDWGTWHELRLRHIHVL